MKPLKKNISFIQVFIYIPHKSFRDSFRSVLHLSLSLFQLLVSVVAIAYDIFFSIMLFDQILFVHNKLIVFYINFRKQ